MKPWVRRLLKISGILLAVVIVLSIGVRIFLTEEKLMALILPRLENALDAEVELAGLQVQFPFGLGVKGTELAFQKQMADAEIDVQVRSFVIKSSLISLIRRAPEIKRARFEEITLHYVKPEGGPSVEAPGFDFECGMVPSGKEMAIDFEAVLPEVTWTGSSTEKPLRLTDLSLRGDGRLAGGMSRLDDLVAVIEWGEVAVAEVRGSCDSLRTSAILDLEIESKEVSLAALMDEIDRLELGPAAEEGEKETPLPRVLEPGSVRFSAAVKGPARDSERLTWSGNLAAEGIELEVRPDFPPVGLESELAFDRERARIEPLRITSQGLEVRAEGEIPLLRGGEGESRKATFEHSGTFDLAQGRTWLEMAGLTGSGRVRWTGNSELEPGRKGMPRTRVEGVFEKVGLEHAGLRQPVRDLELRFSLRLPEEDIEIKDVHFKSGSSTWQGHMRGRDLLESPHLDFEMSADRLLVEEHRNPEAAEGAGAEGAAGEADSEASGIGPETKAPPPPMTAQGNVVIGEVSGGGIDATDLEAEVTWNMGRLEMKPITMKVAGGRVEGSYATNLLELPNPKSEIDLTAKEVDVSQLLEPYFPTGNLISGKVAFDLDAAFLGGSKEAFLSSLVSEGKAELGQGWIGGQRIEQALTKLTAGKRQRIDFRRMHSTFQLENGFLSMEDWEVEGNDANFRAAGGLGLDGRLAYKIEATLSPDWTQSNALTQSLADEDGRARIPILLGGTLKSPSFALDRDLLAQRLRAKGQTELLLLLEGGLDQLFGSRDGEEGVEDRLKEGLGKLGDLLKSRDKKED